MEKIETLINSKKVKYSSRWTPTAIDPFIKAISSGGLINMPKEIRRNIAYSLQYLQYLELQIQELHLHSVVEKMIYKTYVVTSVSIIEAIFIQIVKHNRLWKKAQWENVKNIETKEYEIEGVKYKIENTIYKKREVPIDDSMKFDDVLKKVKDKKLLDMEHQKLYALNRFRKLRNKVHLQIFDEGETNWHEFGRNEYVTIKYLLWCVLTDDRLDNIECKKYFNFLELNDDEQLIVSKLENAD